MPIQSPPLLGTEYDDIGDRTENLAIACTKAGQLNGWTPPAGDSMDMGRALIRIIEKMARHAATRINRMPERNFLAFLDRIGVTPSASRAARVPLTFTLVAGSDAEPTVPGRTRVGAIPLSGDSREVIFETVRDLFTTRANLAAVFIRQPNGDRLMDRTANATGAIAGAFDVFDGGNPATHALYLAADDVFGLATGTSVTCAFVVDTATKWTTLHAMTVPTLTGDSYYPTHQPTAPLVRWTYWNGRAWSPLTVTVPTGTTNLVFTIPSDMTATMVRGRQARWIRGQLLAWPGAGVPTINSMSVSAAPVQTGIMPTAAYANGRPVDLSIDFYPFGETPRLNDMLLVACDGLLDRRGANVTLQIALNAITKDLKNTDGPILTWEVSTVSGWRVVAANVTPTNTVVGSMIRNDVLRTATFTVPADAAVTTIGTTNSVWLRIRLTGGTFGKGLSIDYVPTTPKTTDDGFRPPLIQSLSFSSTPTITNTKPVCVTEDDFAFEDRSASFPMFSRSADDVQTLYLGFDQRFSARETRLYFAVAPLDPVAAAREASASVSGSVVWEYATAGGWKPLICEDETRGFAMSGFVGFVAPEDLGHRSLFSKDFYWFRARLRLPAQLIESPPPSPRVGRILTNTVWALDATTRTNEVLGSADGNADTSFPFAAQPILEGQTIEVREPNAPRDVPKNDISDDVDPRFTSQVWIRWHEVETFYASGPKDRHYTIDREAGVLHFGDGRRGMVPPRGAQNVRASYATGGGTIGNRAIGSVRQLKTTVPYIDGVTNEDTATGGANADTGEDIKTWGPSVLRHGYRAITAQDFEDLALEASPAIARAKAITLDFDAITATENPGGALSGPIAPGTIVLLLATNGTELPPAATTGLLRDVDTYLRARSSPAVNLRLAGPTWIEVSIARLDVTSSSTIDTEVLRERIEKTIAAFFHPITGNLDGTGWAFGALPSESDVYRFVMSIPGVDRIGVLDWSLRTRNGQPPPLFDDPLRNRVLIFPGRQSVRIVSTGGA